MDCIYLWLSCILGLNLFSEECWMPLQDNRQHYQHLVHILWRGWDCVSVYVLGLWLKLPACLPLSHTHTVYRLCHSLSLLLVATNINATVAHSSHAIQSIPQIISAGGIDVCTNYLCFTFTFWNKPLCFRSQYVLFSLFCCSLSMHVFLFIKCK